MPIPAILGAGILGVDLLGDVLIQGAPVAVIAINPVPLAVTPDVSFTPTPCDLGLDQHGEFMLTADGDLALVTGKQRVAQDVWALAVTSLGSEYADPAYGSALAGLVGRRMPDARTLDAYATLLKNQVAALHQKRIAEGNPPGAGEAIASITSTAAVVGPNTVTAPLNVTTQDNQTATVLVPAQ